MDNGTIILDRDGVINENRCDYVKNISEFKFISGSIAAIKLFNNYGFRIVVASNQAGVAKGLINLKDLSEMESMINLHSNCEIEFFYCMHLSTANCPCRKPQPGMLNSIRKKYKGPFLFIGDNVTDFYAAQKANIDFCLVLTGHGLTTRDQIKDKCAVYENLLECAKDLLRSNNKVYNGSLN